MTVLTNPSPWFALGWTLPQIFEHGHARAVIEAADCRQALACLPDCSVDAIVTDPPYELGFMGKAWDASGIAYDLTVWRECLRVLKPGGHALAFSGSRTYHRMVVAIEDAGFEIRDQIMWLYGSGFPKSLDVSKQIDKHGGVSVAWFGPWFRQWRESQGISSNQVAALFPSKTGGRTGCVSNWELGLNMPTPEQFNLIRDTFGLPFDSLEAAERKVVGVKAGSKLAVAPGQDNDRSTTDIEVTAAGSDAARQWQGWGTALKPAHEPICVARKPLDGTVAANVLAHGTGALNIDGCRVDSYDGSSTARKPSMVRDTAAGFGKGLSMGGKGSDLGRWPANVVHDGSDEVISAFPQAGGSAARFFYCAKASRADRGEGNTHPTVKPNELMRYLCRLVTPPGGVVLDPFLGSGSTGRAELQEGFLFYGCDLDPAHVEIARRRMENLG